MVYFCSGAYIATAMEITGGWKQTGKRTTISIIKDSADKTSVRVTITIQKRFKAIQADPWNDPKVDDKASADFAAKMQPEVTASLAQQN